MNEMKNILTTYEVFKKELNSFPFIAIIGKYDQILGPRVIYSSVPLVDKQFIKNLLRDALNTKNKFVFLDFNQFYAQVFKIEVKDESARGKKQLYAIILLRHLDYPLIPLIHFKKMEMIFREIGDYQILQDDANVFKNFFKEISDKYLNKKELTPLELRNLQIRSGINTIQGFCGLIKKIKKENRHFSEEKVLNYIDMMLDSCDDIIKAIEKNSPNLLK